jgi:hypothetical protein
MTQTTDTAHLLTLIHTATTDDDLQPLIREFLRGNHGQLCESHVPAWYSFGFDSAIRFAWHLSHKMALRLDENGISLFVKE